MDDMKQFKELVDAGYDIFWGNFLIPFLLPLQALRFTCMVQATGDFRSFRIFISTIRSDGHSRCRRHRRILPNLVAKKLFARQKVEKNFVSDRVVFGFFHEFFCESWRICCRRDRKRH